MSFLMSANGGVLVGGFLEFERVFKFTLEISIGRKCQAFRGFSRGVQREKLVGPYLLVTCGTRRLACVPAGAAEFIERGMRAFYDAIALHQIHALEGNVEARVLGVTQEHEFTAAAIRFDLAQTLELTDTMIDVDHKNRQALIRRSR